MVNYFKKWRKPNKQAKGGRTVSIAYGWEDNFLKLSLDESSSLYCQRSVGCGETSLTLSAKWLSPGGVPLFGRCIKDALEDVEAQFGFGSRKITPKPPRVGASKARFWSVFRTILGSAIDEENQLNRVCLARCCTKLFLVTCLRPRSKRDKSDWTRSAALVNYLAPASDAKNAWARLGLPG